MTDRKSDYILTSDPEIQELIAASEPEPEGAE